MLEPERTLVDIDGVESAMRQFMQGVAGGWQITNQLLSIAGGSHSNRVAYNIYESEDGEAMGSDYLTNTVTDLEIDRLASQMDIIVSEDEVRAGLILLMSSGLLYGHWKKFIFSDEYRPRTYLSLWKAQYEFETGALGDLPPQEIEPKTRRFNEFHRELNQTIAEVYSELNDKVDDLFNEFFSYLSHNCPMTNEEFDKISKNRLQLLYIKNEDNPIQKLVKKICDSSSNPKSTWNTTLDYKTRINSIKCPEKQYLYQVFNTKRAKQRIYEPRFINHLKSSFGDDFNKIITKLGLEV